MSFKTAAKLEQARLRRPVKDMLPSYFENLNDEQKRDCLKAILASLHDEAERLDLRDRNDRARKKNIGQSIRAICDEIGAIRPKAKAKGVENHFIDAAREILTRDLFQLVMTRAVEKLGKTPVGSQK